MAAAIAIGIAGLGVLTALAAPNRGEPCASIVAACRAAGFVPGGARSAAGLWADCVRPIMRQMPSRRAALPLPVIGPRVVDACRAMEPDFGRRRRSGFAGVEKPRKLGLSPLPNDAGPDQRAYAPNMPSYSARGYGSGRPNFSSPPVQPSVAGSVQSDRATASAPNVPPDETTPATPTDVQRVDNAPKSTSAASVDGKKRPNIVFVLTDDLATNLLQFMPHVLQMQKDGVTFRNYFVTDSLCCPSRASIFTGRYPHDTGVYRNFGPDGGYETFRSRGLERTTFAVALTAAGYRTAMIGKYLNRYRPEQGSPEAPGWTKWAVAGNGYKGFNYTLNQDGSLVRYGQNPSDYLTDVASAQAVQFIKQSGHTPFMLEVATFAPHRPATPAPRDANGFLGLRAPQTPAFGVAPDTSAPPWLKDIPDLSDRDIARIDQEFRRRAQAVQAVDKMIGDLLAALAQTGEANNTIFIFSSDNGYHMGDHRLLPGKQTAFDTDIHVPLIVTGPGIRPGGTVDEITQNIDLCPTFEDIAGVTPPRNVDGSSLLPLLYGQSVPEWRTVALVEHHGPMIRTDEDPDAMDFQADIFADRGGARHRRPGAYGDGRRHGNPPSYEAVRSARWVYVEYQDGVKEFHDLTADPYELRNSFSALAEIQKSALHALVSAIQNCHDAGSCRAAERAVHLAQ
jgi:N-acetylglucosamine-6-sulfatase